MRDRQTIVGVLVFLVVGAGVAGAVSTGITSQTTDDGGERVRVGATGQVQTAPNRAVVRVAVVKRSDDVSVARRALADNVSAVRTALRDAGVGADQIQTVRYDIHTDRDAIDRYRAEHALAVELEDVDRAGEVIDLAVENGATQVGGVEFTLTPERRQRLRNRALERAMTNARSQADTLAARSNLAVTGVHSVSTVEVQRRPVYESVSFATSGGGGAVTSVDRGPVTVTARVDVVYNASDR